MRFMRPATIALLVCLGVLGSVRVAAAGPDSERQALGQDLIQCAAFRSYQKLCLEADAGTDHAEEVQALNKTVQAFLASAWTLLVDLDLVFPPYRTQLDAIRAACKGRCSDVSRLDGQEYARCTAYEQARTDPRNPWRN